MKEGDDLGRGEIKSTKYFFISLLFLRYELVIYLKATKNCTIKKDKCSVHIAFHKAGLKSDLLLLIGSWKKRETFLLCSDDMCIERVDLSHTEKVHAAWCVKPFFAKFLRVIKTVNLFLV